MNATCPAKGAETRRNEAEAAAHETRTGPAWAPPEMDPDRLRADLRRVIDQIVRPIFEGLVQGAEDPLSRSGGLIVCHTLWIELLEQTRLANQYNDRLQTPSSIEALLKSALRNFQRVVEAKVKAGTLLQRLRELAWRREREARAANPEACRPANDIMTWLTGEMAHLTDEPATDAAGRPISEIPGAVDQKAAARPALSETDAARLDEIREIIRQRCTTMARQGTVVSTWRTYQGHLLGPYYRLAWREDGRQRSAYLGRSPELARAVQQVLDNLQRPLRHERRTEEAIRRAWTALRAQRIIWARELAVYGLYLHGWDVRGWRGTTLFSTWPLPKPPQLVRPETLERPADLTEDLRQLAEQPCDCVPCHDRKGAARVRRREEAPTRTNWEKSRIVAQNGPLPGAGSLSAAALRHGKFPGRPAARAPPGICRRPKTGTTNATLVAFLPRCG